MITIDKSLHVPKQRGVGDARKREEPQETVYGAHGQEQRTKGSRALLWKNE
jgi:hypothetical protein